MLKFHILKHLITLTFCYVTRNLDNHPQPYCDKLDTIEEFLKRDSVDCSEVVECLGELIIESENIHRKEPVLAMAYIV